MSTGSLTTTTPGIIVNDALPPTVSARSVPATTEDPVARLATCAEPTTTGIEPKALENFTRARFPPMLVRTTIRTVWFDSVVTRNTAPAGPLPRWADVEVAASPEGGAACEGATAAVGAGVTIGGVVRISCCAVAHVGTQLSCLAGLLWAETRET
jgi:hypothetical protein